MADLNMAVHPQDSGTKSPLQLDTDDEVAQSAHKNMNLPREEDVREETHLMNPTHSNGRKPTEDAVPPTQHDDNQLPVGAASDSLEEEPQDESIREPLLNEEPRLDVAVTADSNHPEEMANKPATSSADADLEQVDGPPIQEYSQDALDDTQDPGEVEEESEPEGGDNLESVPQISTAQEVRFRGRVEDIGPVSEEAEELQEAGFKEGKQLLAVAALVVVLIAVLVHHLVQPKPQEVKNLGRIDIFLREMEQVQTEFPHQRPDMWTRSRIHLKRHLQSAQPSEPVSLILTAGLRARRTLLCLSRRLASVYSTAVNASVLHIDGASKTHSDSDTVKLEIDDQLQGAFEGDKPVAVIHRFEELPPGSTLIFYRYCDHENAAYKNTFLLFTVLLSEDEIPPKSTLGMVEEMVDDHLQKKFLSDGHPVSFDRMDLDKYGGLWSRISHLILPVVSEDRMETGGC